ncbi:hypothetical protein PINS_up008641 [Pythium insidiosum]|nr:hypothetical protein PINS_up008641 [Pythium insidiosum]
MPLLFGRRPAPVEAKSSGGVAQRAFNDGRRVTDPTGLRYSMRSNGNSSVGGEQSPARRLMQFAGGMTHTEDLIREEHNRRKEMERTELIHLILESIASVPMAVEKIHTNPRLRAALTQQMGEQHALLSRIFDGTDIEQERSAEGAAAEQALWAEERPSGSFEFGASPSTIVVEEDDDAESEDDSSAYDSEYENDLADAVNQLVMSEGHSSNHGTPVIISDCD